jgi:putative transcriptional regulator
VKNKLKILRTNKDLNQTDFAELCMVSRQTIHSIEIEKYTPSVELALKIAKNLNKKVEDVFFLEDKK